MHRLVFFETKTALPAGGISTGQKANTMLCVYDDRQNFFLASHRFMVSGANGVLRLDPLINFARWDSTF